MWRLHVLAEFLYWWDLLGIGFAMLKGTYYQTDDREDPVFPEPFDGSAGQVDG